MVTYSKFVRGNKLGPNYGGTGGHLVQYSLIKENQHSEELL